MNQLKSHFQFSRKQRSGIFYLLIIIIIVQCIYFFIDRSPYETTTSQDDVLQFQNEIDSLRLVKIENSKPKIYPFNPNYITDYKGYTLGMTNKEIDRLLKFRSQDKWINSAGQFQEVTKVSDSLLNVIAPYFKFPEWVTNSKPKYTSQDDNTPKSYNQKIDLNKATAIQLQRINGIGKTLSNRIINYRSKFKGGFIANIQLQNVYGLLPEVIQRIETQFTVKTPRPIRKLNLNTATKEQLVTVEYIDYELASLIIEQRVLREGFKTIDELTKVKDFPISKLEIIELYLTTN